MATTHTIERLVPQQSLGTVINLNHAPEGYGTLPVHRAKEIGQFLLSSKKYNHLVDAGWAFVSAASTSSPDGVRPLITQAHEAFNQAVTLTGSTSEKLRATFLSSILPLFQESYCGRKFDVNFLHARTMKINDRILDAVDLAPGTNFQYRGLASEIALMGVLSYHSLNRGDSLVAWPASTWQDKRTARHNLDAGNFPDVTKKIDVRSVTPSPSLPKDVQTIFAPAELTDNPDDPFHINYVLGEERGSARSKELYRFAGSILKKLS